MTQAAVAALLAEAVEAVRAGVEAGPVEAVGEAEEAAAAGVGEAVPVATRSRP